MAGFADLFNLMESKVSINCPNLGQAYKFVNEDEDSELPGQDPFKSTLMAEGTSYADQIKEQEDEDWRRQIVRMQALNTSDTASVPDRAASVMSSAHMDDFTTCGTSAGHAAHVDELGEDSSYDQFDWSQKSRQVLPIDVHKSQLLSLVQSNVVSIVRGATGCGKSTQLPLYILEDAQTRRRPVQIVVTQPRRIAAVSVAERVCRERGWRVGDLVGYQIGQNRVASDYTKLLYCTTGVLLQRLVKQKSIDNLNYIILDEVHERDKDMDFLMIVIRKLMRTNVGKTHIVLMSATLDIHKLSKYFSHYHQEYNVFQNARIYQINATHPHQIYKFYLEQIAFLDAQLYKKLPVQQLAKPQIVPEQFEYVTKLVNSFDVVDEADTGTSACSGGSAAGVKRPRGSVLIFLPGIHEITEMHTALENYLSSVKKSPSQWKIVILHSTIPKEQQDLVFSRPPPDVRKIVLSTNIAESSITVPDIKYVIDFCLTKVLTVAEGSNFSSLQLEWASESSCQQRAGRVGRVSEGRVYYMVTSDFYDQLPVEDTPEMLRSPLDSLVLSAKMLDLGDPVHIFGLALDPPDIGNIKRTILSLKEIGALYPTTEGEYRDDDGDLTLMGRVMSTLPVDPRVAKLIYLGYIFNVLDDCVIMAAAMSVKSPFSSPYREEMEAYCSKLIWADSSCSDLIAFLHLYKVWHSQKTRGFFHRSRGSSEKTWARQNFVQLASLREIEKLVTDIMMRLRHQEIRNDPEFTLEVHERAIILKIVIGGAFYPNYFFRGGSESGGIDEKSAIKTLGGHDPMNTVYLKGLPPSQLGLVPLYAGEIKKHMRFCHPDDMKIYADSSKVFIHFKDQSGKMKPSEERLEYIPGKVNISVFKAVKSRMINRAITLKCYKDVDGAKKMEEMGLQTKKEGMQSFSEGGTSKPGAADRFINIRIIHVENLSKFWAQNADCYNELCQITEQINDPENLEPLSGVPKVGAVLAAPFSDHTYYRAKVLRLNRNKTVLVKYIDYGNELDVPVAELRNFGPALADQDLATRRPYAFECCLAEVTPALLFNHHGLWSREAVTWFCRHYLNSSRALIAEIYSIVDGVVKIILYNHDRRQPDLTVNKEVIKLNFATEMEESYRSKLDHDNRARNLYCQGLNDIEDDTDVLSEEVETDDSRKKITVSLQGPFSPLETKVMGPLQSVCSKPVHIDRESVNCVLLETEPQDNSQRILVSAFCSTNYNSDILKVRETTLMPNLPGLPALLCLLFAPQVELRANKDRTKVIGALCGLGYRMKENGRFESLYPDNDMEVSFNIQVKNKFLTLVNALRLVMNTAVTDDKTEIDVIRRNCKQLLLQLLLLPADPAEFDFFPKRFQWGQIAPDHLLNPKNRSEETHPCQLTAQVYHLVWGIMLATAQPESVNAPLLWENLRELHVIADGLTPMKNVICELCKVHLDDHQTLRVHLSTHHHEQHVKWLENLSPRPAAPPPHTMVPPLPRFHAHKSPQGYPAPSPQPTPEGVFNPQSRPHSRAGPPNSRGPSRNGPPPGSRAPSRNSGPRMHAQGQPQSPLLMPPHSFAPVQSHAQSRPPAQPQAHLPRPSHRGKSRPNY